MAKNTNSGKRIHVTPGVYTPEKELEVAAKSLGITTLGLVGETTRGAAFQTMSIGSWSEFQHYFGGTSTKKYRGSQYPKYELPYIAKEYLSQSQKLEVVRVLGLSGTNAGDAWVISAFKKGATAADKYARENAMVVAVLRSRGEHMKATFVSAATGDECNDKYEYDNILYYAKDIKLVESNMLSMSGKCDLKYGETKGEIDSEGNLTVDVNDYGRFTLEVTRHDDTIRKFSVSLNPDDKNYITNVLGTDPEDGDAEIFVEELYDVAYKQLLEEGKVNSIRGYYLPKFSKTFIVPKYKAVDDILSEDQSMLTRKDVGKRLLFSQTSVDAKKAKFKVQVVDNTTWTAEEGKIGHIYTVQPHVEANGTRKYYYVEYKGKEEALGDPTVDATTSVLSEVVEVKSHASYYIYEKTGKVVAPITLDLNNYKEQYRYASTPWVVSELKGSANFIDINKLFRFHTISDGKESNTEVKISIENIDGNEGTFDVVVRSFYDVDANPVVLEKFKGCNLIPSDENYIAYRIGSTDDSYETKSKYITVEVNENENTRVSIPAGFMGYPIRNWVGNHVQPIYGGATKDAKIDGLELSAPQLKYNTMIGEDIRPNKQYFGLSNITGIDADILSYKGVEAYDDAPEGMTPCFHLDARLFNGKPTLDTTENSETKDHYVLSENSIKQVVAIDGVEGYSWSTVNRGNVTEAGIEPRIGKEDDMLNTIYEDKRYRKFTVAFYGGWDGWDYYRTYRSNTNDFKAQKYRGDINPTSGQGINLSVIKNAEQYGFEEGEKIINSDYYAYLSGAKMFANPKTIDINVFATPGIDYVNNSMLVDEVEEMISEERADSIYVVTTPDKPFGAGDSVSEMYTPSEAVDNLEDSELDSNYACTFYPWVKVLDTAENQYIFLPATKDVVKAFALTDNIAQPWYAASGMNRGVVNGIKPKRTLKLNEQDTLYDGRINPITTFATEGMRIWGDKNLQKRESVMNRISKRRLMLRLRKLISLACIGLIFDPNDPTMGQTLRNAVETVMSDFRSKGGIVNYKIEIDDSQETRDRMELGCKILVKPVVNLEYITIEFFLTMQGTLFED